MQTEALRVWNRAALEQGGPDAREGDRALAGLLYAHRFVMHGGLAHAIEGLTDEELAHAIAGYRYFAFDDVADLLGQLRAGVPANRSDAADERCRASIPDESKLAEHFEALFADRAHVFAPIPAKQLGEREIAGVLATDGPSRYEHFVKQAADWQLVWGLRAAGGWVSMADGRETAALPVWPHEAYARLLAIDAWADAEPTAIEVHEWIDDYLPELGEAHRQVAVFPTPAAPGVLVDAEQLRTDIEAELDRLE